MRMIFYLMFKTSKGLDILDDKYEDDLYRETLTIFSFFSIVRFLLNFHEENAKYSFFYNLYLLVLAILISVFFGIIFSLITHKVGKLLKGKASYIEICSLYAYALIPIIIGDSFKFVLRGMHTSQMVDFDSFRLLSFWNAIVFSLLSLKILVLGLKKFNQYSYLKSAINSAILVLPVLGFWLYFVFN
ncbi:YIP1 family protein [Tenacibaculum halocynthiae]|uniref:YIP1 family protein n=1 Tax=Tenacibaculum halocynthiae TaxID=1254437 RepID=UPI0038956E4C